MLPLEDDPLTAENLIQDNIRHYCNVVNFAYELGPPVMPARDQEANVTSVHGLACAKNFSLNMVAVDSVRNYHFAESLGIDVTNKKDMTAVVILDTKVRKLINIRRLKKLCNRGLKLAFSTLEFFMFIQKSIISKVLVSISISYKIFRLYFLSFSLFFFLAQVFVR